ncbi:hypothetical protein [Kitasatospora azatica]|uniref:hypothetical protein n=1 Tax=Kitasatospora azatica TaxID=58347 RepID=UPI000AFAB8B4|nr:hypothetical protein [Kitasatospora azatica]
MAKPICPRCTAATPVLDPDLQLCPDCCEQLRHQLTGWLMHLVGLAVLAREPR